MALTQAVSKNSTLARLLRKAAFALAAIVALALSANGQAEPPKKTSSPMKADAAPPTVAEAERFISQAEIRLLDLWIKSERATWVSETYITDDTEAISADADAAVKAATADLARQARRYEKLRLPPDVARKFKLLKSSVDIPAPHNAAAQAELAKIDVSLDSDYGKGTWCPDDAKGGKTDNCKQLPDIEKIMAKSRDSQELLNAWKGWHSISPPMRKRYSRMVELSNQGAREMGFADVGAMWRSNYDMPPDEFAKELDRLWGQVRPLYVSLHAYVRWKLAEKYGKDLVREDEPIPAHLLGNMWSQEWNNIYPLLAPSTDNSGPDVASGFAREKCGRQGNGSLRGGIFQVARFRAASVFVLGAIHVHQAAGPRSGLPRQRFGHRFQGRRADQSVHRAHGRGFHDRAPRARPQFLSASVQWPARPCSAIARMTDSMKRSATPSLCRSRRNI